MPVKDKIVSWYVQNILIPRVEIIDKPGFVITNFTEKNQTTYLRELFISEQLFEDIEKGIIQTYRDEGKQILYSAGKKFGYTYASISNFPNINKMKEKDFLDFAYYLVRYIEGMFSAKATHKIDLDKKIFEISFDNYIICRNNGLGYIMTDGGTAGIWAYALQDKTIEGLQIECQGRNDKKCKVICCPDKILKEKKLKYLSERELEDIEFDETYTTMNDIRPATYSNNSLKNLLDTGFFEYERGLLRYKNIRFFPVESHVLYYIEEEISKLKDGEQKLFDICMNHGRRVRQEYGEIDWDKFISDYYPALGFGDIAVLDSKKPTVASIYYPWTLFSEKSKFIIFRGILSGIISDSVGHDIKINNYETDLSDYLTLTIST